MKKKHTERKEDKFIVFSTVHRTSTSRETVSASNQTHIFLSTSEKYWFLYHVNSWYFKIIFLCGKERNLFAVYKRRSSGRLSHTSYVHACIGREAVSMWKCRREGFNKQIQIKYAKIIFLVHLRLLKSTHTHTNTLCDNVCAHDLFFFCLLLLSWLFQFNRIRKKLINIKNLCS